MKYALENTENLEKRGARIVAKISADRLQFDIVKETHEQSIEACRVVPDYLFDACIRGILNGFIQHGEPGNLHEKGYAFCDEKQLTDIESLNCYKKFTEMLQWEYDDEQMKTACAHASKKREIQTCLI